MNHNSFDITTLTFQRRLFMLPPLVRSAIRIIIGVFIIVWCGATAAFLISDIPRAQWIGIFSLLIFIDFIIHASRAHYTLDALFLGNVPQHNVALCSDRRSLQSALEALERSQTQGGDMWCFLAYDLAAHTRAIHIALDRLDISSHEFIQTLEQEYKKSLTTHEIVLFDRAYREIGELFIRASFLARSHTHAYIDSSVLFAALLQMGKPRLVKVLDLFSITGADIDGSLAYGDLAKKTRSLPASVGGFARAHTRTRSYRVNRTLTSRPTPTLDMYGDDLTERARIGEQGFLIGHENEYRSMIHMLSSQTNRNVLLIGEAGVGKETLVSHLAFEIITDAVPASLFDRRVVLLSLSSLLTGVSGVDAIDRIQRVTQEIIRAGNIILYIPDIHLLFAQSNASGVALADALLPILQSNTFPVIGSTYPREEKLYITQASAFSGLFQTLRLEELSISDTIRFLTYDALLAERTHTLTIYFSAIKKIAEYASKYLHTKPLPAAARDLLAEVVSSVLQRNQKKLRDEDVITVVEQRVHIPIHTAQHDEAEKLLHLEDEIHKTFIDQEDAVRAVAQALRAYRSGLARTNGPIASFLFVGPTGVGKTELSKLLAKINFGSEALFTRLDMSEYQQKESITRFIGSSQGTTLGTLTEAVLAHPYSLILLDEIEKAHPDILNLFLQVFDDGRLTDALGRVVNFSNTIIVATSNAHANFIQERIEAGEGVAQFGDVLKKKLTEIFRPEFLNRFSDIIVFRPLALESVTQIARLHIISLQQLLRNTHGVSLVVPDEVIARIARLGFDPLFGARPLRKVIDTQLKALLSQKILTGELKRGATVSIAVSDPDGFVMKVNND